MAFADDVVGGQNGLIRTWIKSPDFVAGSAGWIIRKDGTVEFNDGVFRGSITSGSDPGKHIVINNPDTGDAVDVYDTLNRLVFSIDGDGVVTSNDYLNNASASLDGIVLNFDSIPASGFNTPQVFANIVPASSIYALVLNSGCVNGTGRTSSFELRGSTNGVLPNATIFAHQRGLTGNSIQNDAGTTPAVNNIIHAGTTLLACGAGGLWNQAHGCAFTPTMAVVTEQGPAGTIPIVFVVDNVGFGPVNWQGHAFNGGAAFVGNVSANVVFFG